MNPKQIAENVPNFVKQTMGMAQMRLTRIQGDARKVVKGTWKKLLATPSLKRVESTVEGWRRDYQKRMDLAKIRKQAERVGHDAFRTVGIATQADLKNVMRQLDNLRSDVRKLSKKADHRRSHNRNHNRNQAQKPTA
ncbi:MAG TPA: hypothetical protein PK668_07875 [Myxococcota bacterium]|nr:hypothetical protein [Myxococcota bacterium]HRY93108.1 hypothetical protein [Myxococcota bacterium]HSA20360.1 hypothetical protein [Myxococcota bacterium]